MQTVVTMMLVMLLPQLFLLIRVDARNVMLPALHAIPLQLNAQVVLVIRLTLDSINPSRMNAHAN